MDAYLQPLLSCRLYTTIFWQKKKDLGENKKNRKNTVKWMFTLGMRGKTFVCVYVGIIFAYCCVCSYIWLLVCVWVYDDTYITEHIWRCPWCNRRCLWCNGYRRRKWTWRHEFKSWTRLIAFHIALIALGKVWIQLFSLQLWVNSRAD